MPPEALSARGDQELSPLPPQGGKGEGEGPKVAEPIAREHVGDSADKRIDRVMGNTCPGQEQKGDQQGATEGEVLLPAVKAKEAQENEDGRNNPQVPADIGEEADCFPTEWRETGEPTLL